MNYQSVVEEKAHLACSRPIELYVFIDPLCPDCWALQPLLRRLQVEYEQYFTLRTVMRTSLANLNMLDADCCQTPYCDNSNLSFPSLAIKAAEFQGKRAGFRFLSKLLDRTFSQSKDITSFDVLVEVARSLHLDIDEFICDFRSKHVLRALQVDLFLASEMEVDRAPTFVFFNENIEDEGLKVDGVYDYDVYVQILSELLEQTIYPDTPPPLEQLLTRFDSMTTEELASIYNEPLAVVERELKKKVLLQQVERLPYEGTSLWKLKRHFCMNP